MNASPWLPRHYATHSHDFTHGMRRIVQKLSTSGSSGAWLPLPTRFDTLHNSNKFQEWSHRRNSTAIPIVLGLVKHFAKMSGSKIVSVSAHPQRIPFGSVRLAVGSRNTLYNTNQRFTIWRKIINIRTSFCLLLWIKYLYIVVCTPIDLFHFMDEPIVFTLNWLRTSTWKYPIHI